MEWNHMYVSGGLADQNPMLLRCFDMIHRIKAEHEKEKNKQREAEQKAKRQNPRGGARPRGGRRR